MKLLRGVNIKLSLLIPRRKNENERRKNFEFQVREEELQRRYESLLKTERELERKKAKKKEEKYTLLKLEVRFYIIILQLNSYHIE
jgi:hypothetical protein